MKATVGLPFSEQDDFFALSIYSILAQTHEELEVILVGDAPSDRSLDIARRASNDPRVRLVVHNERRGLAHRLNEIAQLASSEYLFRMDADDVMRRDRIEVELEALKLHNYDVVGSYAYAINGSNEILGLFAEAKLPSFPTKSLKSNLFTHPTVGGRAEWFRQNPYDESFLRCQDKELWLRTMNSSNFGKVELPLLFYRISSSASAAQRATSSKYDRLAVRVHGPKIAGRPQTCSYLVKSRVKDVAYKALESVGQSERVQVRRYETLSPSQTEEAAKELVLIEESSVARD